MTARDILNHRLQKRKPGRLDVRTSLLHFALINYAVPKERLENHIPVDRFEIPEFEVDGRPQAMLSVVPFVDADFHFYRIAPWFKFRFPQTNHRVYVIDRATGEDVVWFFGTTLGSRIVHLPRLLWRIPWYHASYKIACEYDPQQQRYQTYSVQISSSWCEAQIEIEDTGAPVQVTAEERLILTHPVDGFYDRLDGRTGGYSIWHEEIPLTQANPINLYFSLYERLGIMNRQEMQKPHSIFLCPDIEFDVYMPPGAR